MSKLYKKISPKLQQFIADQKNLFRRNSNSRQQNKSLTKRHGFLTRPQPKPRCLVKRNGQRK